MFQEFIRKVVERQNLSTDEAILAMTEIMEGRATAAQIACFLTAMRMKGETVEEISGFARVMREKATHINAGESVAVDTCGTGGDRKGTFNVSTAAALVVAGAGVRVAKHGNRSVSSQCGSADVLEALGVNIEASPEIVERCIREANFGFLFAPRLHGAMKYAIGPRREIGIRTVFNILGPLTNPAGAPCQVLGVYDANLLEPLAAVLRNLGSRHCFVVHGLDGMDEISTTSPTKIAELSHGQISLYQISPEDLGLSRAEPNSLAVKSVAESVDVVRRILAGEKGAPREIVLANASAALVAAGAAKDLREGVLRAGEAVDSGRAQRVLETLIKLSNQR